MPAEDRNEERVQQEIKSRRTRPYDTIQDQVAEFLIKSLYDAIVDHMQCFNCDQPLQCS